MLPTEKLYFFNIKAFIENILDNSFLLVTKIIYFEIFWSNNPLPPPPYTTSPQIRVQLPLVVPLSIGGIHNNPIYYSKYTILTFPIFGPLP